MLAHRRPNIKPPSDQCHLSTTYHPSGHPGIIAVQACRPTQSSQYLTKVGPTPGSHCGRLLYTYHCLCGLTTLNKPKSRQVYTDDFNAAIPTSVKLKTNKTGYNFVNI